MDDEFYDIQDEQIQFLDDEELPSLGEMIIAGLLDIKAGRYTEVSTPDELQQYLDNLFSD